MVAQTWSVVRRLPSLLGLALVRCYQVLISPLLPASCRYYPSCSSYAVQAIGRHGLVWGTALASWRLVRCNPWTAGGVDDVPVTGWRDVLRRDGHAHHCAAHLETTA